VSRAGNAPILNISGTISLLTGPTRCQRPDRQFYAAAYARDDGVRAGFEYFKNFEQDAKDFAALSTTKLNMPLLVLSGEKASGTFLIDQAKLVATNVTGNVMQDSGHWLIENHE